MKNLAVFMPLCRLWRVDEMAKQICSLDYSGLEIDKFDVVIVIDNSDITPRQVHDMFDEYGFSGNRVIIRETGNPGANEVNVGLRRDRITKVWELAKRYIPDYTDLVFCIEDDTEIKPNYLSVLYENYHKLLNDGIKIGVVSGVQAGRWGFKMIGAWKCDDPVNPKVMETVPFETFNKIQEVDACGFYCFLTRRDLLMKSQYRFDRFDRMFGPDVNFGLDLRAQGYRNFILWDIKAAHKTRTGVVLPDEQCIVLRYEQRENRWTRTYPTTNPSL